MSSGVKKKHLATVAHRSGGRQVNLHCPQSLNNLGSQ